MGLVFFSDQPQVMMHIKELWWSIVLFTKYFCPFPILGSTQDCISYRHPQLHSALQQILANALSGTLCHFKDTALNC